MSPPPVTRSPAAEPRRPGKESDMISRRNLFTGMAAMPLARALVAGADARKLAAAPAARSKRGFAPPLSGRDKLRDRYFPNVELTTSEGEKVRFYDDLLKDKIVVLNLMYAKCDGICP